MSKPEDIVVALERQVKAAERHVWLHPNRRVPYSVDPDLLRDLLQAAAKYIREHP